MNNGCAAGEPEVGKSMAPSSWARGRVHPDPTRLIRARAAPRKAARHLIGGIYRTKKTGGSISTRPPDCLCWPASPLACLVERIAEAEHELVNVREAAGRFERRAQQLVVHNLQL